MPQLGNKYLPCSCYGAASKVCTTGCGCPCHSTPEFRDKLDAIRQEYADLLSKANGTSGFDGDEIDKIRDLISHWEQIKILCSNLDSIGEYNKELIEMLEWYKRIRNM